MGVYFTEAVPIPVVISLLFFLFSCILVLISDIAFRSFYLVPLLAGDNVVGFCSLWRDVIVATSCGSVSAIVDRTSRDSGETSCVF